MTDFANIINFWRMGIFLWNIKSQAILPEINFENKGHLLLQLGLYYNQFKKGTTV